MGFRDSSPCENCFSLMKNLNVKKILYSTNDGLIYMKLRDYNSFGHTTGNTYMFK